jgi:hypothetical protein
MPRTDSHAMAFGNGARNRAEFKPRAEQAALLRRNDSAGGQGKLAGS